MTPELPSTIVPWGRVRSVSGSPVALRSAVGFGEAIVIGPLLAHASPEEIRSMQYKSQWPSLVLAIEVGFAGILAPTIASAESPPESREADGREVDGHDDDEDDDHAPDSGEADRYDDDMDNDGEEHEGDDMRFDSGFNIYISPGGLNQPYGGRDSVDYLNSYDPGYQWGLGVGYFMRSNSAFALHVGPFFEHAILNGEGRGVNDGGENMFRAGLELEPGVVLGERVFLGLPLRGGYAGDVFANGDEDDVSHGGFFGVGLGLDLAVWRGLYLGTSIGTDLHFFRSRDDFNVYSLSWRTRIGYRF